MKEFKDTDRFQKGDKASWYSDHADKNISGTIVEIHSRYSDGEPIYVIKNDGTEYTRKEKSLDKIPLTDITVQRHNNLTSHISMDSSEFFATITMATNYASDKLEELRTKGFKNLTLSDPTLDTQIAKIKESYDYWDSEYERLSKMREDLR